MSRVRKILTFSVIVAVSMAGSVLATDYHVNGADGNDLNTGLTYETALLFLHKIG